MIKSITTTDQAECLSDISDRWKVVAKRQLRSVSGETLAVWEFTGALSDPKEKTAFRRLSFGFSKPDKPPISCVTGRDALGVLCLYARAYPPHLRGRDRR